MPSLPLSLGEFVSRLEAANIERFDDESWTFNDGQKTAITHGEGPLWITAGPGKREDGGASCGFLSEQRRVACGQ